jgi:hypothetical protein
VNECASPLEEGCAERSKEVVRRTTRTFPFRLELVASLEDTNLFFSHAPRLACATRVQKFPNHSSLKEGRGDSFLPFGFCLWRHGHVTPSHMAATNRAQGRRKWNTKFRIDGDRRRTQKKFYYRSLKDSIFGWVGEGWAETTTAIGFANGCTSYNGVIHNDIGLGEITHVNGERRE